MAERAIGLGVAGLGRGFSLMLPTLDTDPRVKLVAACDSRAEARERFAAAYGARPYDTVEALCRDREVEAVYIATPHQFHAAHALATAKAGKHMLIEKPLAVSLEDCAAMDAAARAAGVHIVVGHSHSFDAPVRAAKRLIDGGAYGPLRLVTALNFTDFMYRPRRPEELDTAQGGGVVFSQGAHQIDVARYLAGGMALSVRAMGGVWDKTRPSEGAYAAFLTFAGGAAATLTYSGYGHFDTDEFCGWIAESGMRKDKERYGEARRLLQGVADPAAEAALKASQADGATSMPAPRGERLHAHFGRSPAAARRRDDLRRCDAPARSPSAAQGAAVRGDRRALRRGHRGNATHPLRRLGPGDARSVPCHSALLGGGARGAACPPSGAWRRAIMLAVCGRIP
jgi:phthalate 4,5-cis-dihydrodiol dehydrogenase